MKVPLIQEQMMLDAKSTILRRPFAHGYLGSCYFLPSLTRDTLGRPSDLRGS